MIQPEAQPDLVAYSDAHDDLDLDWLVRAGNALTFHVMEALPETDMVNCLCGIAFDSEDVWRKHVANEMAHALFDDMEDYVLDTNVKNGWYEDERHALTGHMLTVTEIAEASEAHRLWGSDDVTGIHELEKAKPALDGTLMPKPLGAGSEYGDVLVRLLDQTKRERDGGVKNLFFEFKRDMAYNVIRGYRHGNKRV